MLLAYAKLSLHDELLDSPVPDDPYLGKELERYFPVEMRERFPDAIADPPPAPRDHRDAARQRHHQSRRPDDRHAPRRPDRRRCADDRGGLRGDARLVRPDRAQRRRSTPSTGSVPGALQLQLYGDLQDLLMSRIVWFIRNVDFNGELPRRASSAPTGPASPRSERGLAETLLPPRAGAWDDARPRA